MSGIFPESGSRRRGDIVGVVGGTGAYFMKALNGWQRIGIVLSVLWATVGLFWGNNLAVDDLGRVGIL
jgi:hypothetical protein